MNSTKLYIAYAAAGIATFNGGAVALPSFTHQLSLEAVEIISSSAYRTRTPAPISLLATIEKASGEYPVRGRSLKVDVKVKLHRAVPLLEKEKYNFRIYEG